MFSKRTRNYNLLKRYVRKLGVDAFGIADISGMKDSFSLSPGACDALSFAVCLGVRLSSSVLSEIRDAPTRLYFHHYKSVNYLLDQSALKITGFIQKRGFWALPIPASQLVDWQAQKGHLSHKEAAARAGLGWIGRNNLLVHKKFGSRLRLVTVLTDMPLKADTSSEEDCGRCLRCLGLCPAQAIKEKVEEFDHLACYNKLKEFQRKRLVDQYICGVCVNACNGTGKR